MKIIIIGPAYPLRGGIATFDHRLARQLIDEGHNCTIYSFSLQYPSMLFPGKSQYSDGPAPQGIQILSKINSINPFNWLAVGNALKRMKPDLIVVRYWLPFMGPALGTILRRIRKNNHTKIIAVTDNVLPHEKRPGDIRFTKYFLRSCDAFLTMSEKVFNDLKSFKPKQPAKISPHPLYDSFGEAVSKEVAKTTLGIDKNTRLILFFGFIRKYKGLDLLLQAMGDERIRKAGIKLLVAGEFYEDESAYRNLISDNNLDKAVELRADFIPDSEVRYYMCAADVVVQPYRNATQSGVTPLAYHFEKPMIVTDVGGLPDMVPHQKVGLVTKPEARSIADAILRFYELGEDFFIPHLRSEKQKYSWHTFVKALLSLEKEIKK